MKSARPMNKFAEFRGPGLPVGRNGTGMMAPRPDGGVVKTATLGRGEPSVERVVEEFGRESASQAVREARSDGSGGVVPARVEAGETAVEKVQRLASLISREVVLFRRSGDESVSVVLRPDADTELRVRIQHRPDGIELAVRCERGDAAALHGQWHLLREALAEQQVRLLPIPESGGGGAESGGLSQGRSGFAEGRFSQRQGSAEEPPMPGGDGQPGRGGEAPEREPGPATAGRSGQVRGSNAAREFWA